MNSAAPSFWDFVDRLYCVSLREREDRRQAALQEYAKGGLTDRVEFVLGERHPADMEERVYVSHMLRLRKGLEAGAESVDIYEDGGEFDRFDPQRLRSATEFLQQHREWKVFHIGGLKRIRRSIEYCHRHKFGVYSAYVLVILLALFALFY